MRMQHASQVLAQRSLIPRPVDDKAHLSGALQSFYYDGHAQRIFCADIHRQPSTDTIHEWSGYDAIHGVRENACVGRFDFLGGLGFTVDFRRLVVFFE
jgi:hypothetical protein